MDEINAAGAGDAGSGSGAAAAGSGLAGAGSGVAGKIGVGVRRPGSNATAMAGRPANRVDSTAVDTTAVDAGSMAALLGAVVGSLPGSYEELSLAMAIEEMRGNAFCGTAGTCKSSAAIARITEGPLNKPQHLLAVKHTCRVMSE